MELKEIEEKAKAYDEASKWMEGIYPTLTHEQQMEAEAFFQIFKESEDEKIRKELIAIYSVGAKANAKTGDIPDRDIVAWLEKQGKQKETLCDKCKKTQPSHSCQDITALGRCALEKQGEQKPAWSEEDEKMIEAALQFAHEYGRHGLWCWLKSLKDRVQPLPKQEWSVEDNERIEQICEDLKCGLINFKSGRTVKGLHFEEIIESNIDWLKSLRPQSTWKPSDEQMKALSLAMCGVGDPLFSLYQDLEKLKG